MKQKSKMLVVLISLSCTLLACSAAPSAPPGSSLEIKNASPTVVSSSITATPSVNISSLTATPTLQIKQSATQMVMSYYQTLQIKNYTQAYSYLNADAITLGGKQLSFESFQQLAQEVDQTDGVIMHFSLIPDSSDATMIIMTITRNPSSIYHAHIKVQDMNGEWKIISIDRL